MRPAENALIFAILRRIEGRSKRHCAQHKVRYAEDMAHCFHEDKQQRHRDVASHVHCTNQQLGLVGPQPPHLASRIISGFGATIDQRHDNAKSSSRVNPTCRKPHGLSDCIAISRVAL